ncbi:hypothetical protein GCM10027399_01110 [Curvibacter fontanus]
MVDQLAVESQDGFVLGPDMLVENLCEIGAAAAEQSPKSARLFLRQAGLVKDSAAECAETFKALLGQRKVGQQATDQQIAYRAKERIRSSLRKSRQHTQSQSVGWHKSRRSARIGQLLAS